MKRSKKAIIWFRWDLRIEDKEALFKASILAEEIIPIITFNSKILIPSLPEAVQKSPPPLSCRAIETVSQPIREGGRGDPCGRPLCSLTRKCQKNAANFPTQPWEC